MLLTEFFPRGHAFGRLLEKKSRRRCRAAAIRQGADRQLMDERTESDTQLVADFHLFRRLWPQAVELDLPAVDRFRGQGSCFEEAGSPQPFVDADAIAIAARVIRHGENLSERWAILCTGVVALVSATGHITDP